MTADVTEILIRGKRIFVAENHHDSLLSWAQIRRTLTCAPMALVLDHHTDTLPAFHHAPGQRCEGRWESDTEINEVISRLHHDEQFDFAVNHDILSNVLFITHEDFSIEHDRRLEIVHEDPPDKSINGLGKYYSMILESSFLEDMLNRAKVPLSGHGFILDIDLDCFKGKKSISPDDNKVICDLIRKCEAITICRERIWVQLLNMDFDRSADWQFFYEHLLELIDQALASGEQ